MRSTLGHLVISVVIMGGFGATIAALLMHAVPAENSSLATALLGTMSAMAVAVTNYWLGSSASSARKDQVIAAAQVALANSTPVAPEDRTLPEPAAEEKQ